MVRATTASVTLAKPHVESVFSPPLVQKIKKARAELITAWHWELLLCEAPHGCRAKAALAGAGLAGAGAKQMRRVGEKRKESKDNAGYPNQLLTFAKNSFGIKGGEQENAESR